MILSDCWGDKGRQEDEDFSLLLCDLSKHFPLRYMVISFLNHQDVNVNSYIFGIIVFHFQERIQTQKVLLRSFSSNHSTICNCLKRQQTIVCFMLAKEGAVSLSFSGAQCSWCLVSKILNSPIVPVAMSSCFTFLVYNIRFGYTVIMAKMIQDNSKIFGNELYNSLLQWLNQASQHGHVLIYAHVQPRVFIILF